MNYVNSLNNLGLEMRQLPCFPGKGAPTTATVGAVGEQYMDTDTGKVYKCTSAEGGVYVWELEADGSDLQELSDKIGGPTISEYTKAITKTAYWDIEHPTEDGKQYVVTVKGYTGQNLTRLVLYHCNSSADSTLIKGGVLVGEPVVFDGNSYYKYVKVVATISPEEDQAETLTATIGEYVSKSLFEKVGDIEDFVGMRKVAPNVLILGDSYSAMAGGRWITQLKSLVSLGDVVNLGVSSATLKDKYTDRTTYPYSDRPVSSAGNGNNINTFGSQVEKLKRLMLGEDLDDGESMVYENSAPDIILIEGGTNDLVDDSTDNYVSQIYTVEQAYIASRFNGTARSGAIKIPTPYEETDRTTFAGAMRYLYGVLHEMFPAALIFFITPCGLHYMSGSTHKYLEKGEQIKKAASLLATPVIDWGVNGRLTLCDNAVTGTGTEDDPYIYDAAGEYSVDALHPNEAGAKLLAMEVAKALNGYNLASYIE